MYALRFSARRSLGVVVGTFLVGLAFSIAACGGGPAAQATDGAIGVTMSQLSLTFENRAGLPLIDVDIAILPVGGATEYKKLVGRMETGQKRDLSLSEFVGRDGTPFSLRVVKPKAVRVKAKDLVGKVYEIEVPWS